MRRAEFLFQRLEQGAAARHDRQFHALGGKRLGDGAADAGAGAGDQGCFSGNLQIHCDAIPEELN